MFSWGIRHFVGGLIYSDGSPLGVFEGVGLIPLRYRPAAGRPPLPERFCSPSKKNRRLTLTYGVGSFAVLERSHHVLELLHHR